MHNDHLVLIDVENVCGCSLPCRADVERLKRELPNYVDDFAEAQVVVASSHKAGEAVMFGFPTALRRLRSGPDGADLALLDVLSDRRVICRYKKVTICSGDGMFTEIVSELGMLGVEVVIVSLEGCVNNRLRMAASRCILMPRRELESGPTARMVS